MKGNIDEPLEGALISNTRFQCSGWIFSEMGIKKIMILIDRKNIGEAKYGILRRDVKNTYPDIPAIENSGFRFSRKITLENGSHTLEVQVIDNKKKIISFQRIFLISKPEYSFCQKIFSVIQKWRFGDSISSEPRNYASQRYLKGEGIEIGALQNPLQVNNGVKVKYVDHFPPNKLYNHYSNLDQRTFVNVDIIDDGEVLSTITDCSIDFIIANHFLEHCENPIGTIRCHLKKIRKYGILYYAIPDKNFTFDLHRPLTSFSHMIEDDRNSSFSKYEHFREWVIQVEKHKQESEISQRINELMDMNYSIHYHVWDAKSLLAFFNSTNEILENPFKILYFNQNNGEIITILQKNK